MSETVMSEYIKGFNDGYAYVLEQMERHPTLTILEMLLYLKGDGREAEIRRGQEIIEQKSQAN